MSPDISQLMTAFLPKRLTEVDMIVQMNEADLFIYLNDQIHQI